MSLQASYAFRPQWLARPLSASKSSTPAPCSIQPTPDPLVRRSVASGAEPPTAKFAPDVRRDTVGRESVSTTGESSSIAASQVLPSPSFIREGTAETTTTRTDSGRDTTEDQDRDAQDESDEEPGLAHMSEASPLQRKSIFQAAWDGDVFSLKWYLQQGADFNTFGYDDYGFGLYLKHGAVDEFVAVESGGGKVVDMATPLQFATCSGMVEAVRLLTQPQLPIDPHLRLATTGATAKDIARVNNLRDILNILDIRTLTYDVHSPEYDNIVRRTMHSQKATAAELAPHLRSNWQGLPVVDDQIREEWYKLDPDGTGVITMDQLRDAFLSWDTVGVERSYDEVSEIIRRHTGLMDNQLVCYEEFACLLCHVTAHY